MELTHIDENGNANMVDVGNKDILKREAKAQGKIYLSKETMPEVERTQLLKNPYIYNFMKENGYDVEELNTKEIVVAKKLYSTDGAILSDIYNVANQVNCLNGTYEGYKID